MAYRLKKYLSLFLLFIFMMDAIINVSGLFLIKALADEQKTDISINFQPNGSVPDGYEPDYGDVYGARNGYTYGWNTSHSDSAFLRNINQDITLDTLINIKPEGVWEIALPNGDYDVTLSVGDSVYSTNMQNNSIKVENINFFSNISLEANEFKNSTQKISVTDGKLSLYQDGINKSNIPLNYIHIATPIPTPTPTAPVIPVPTSKLKLQMFNKSTADLDKQIDPNFKVINTSNKAINMKDIKIRYYYFVGGDTPQNFWCDWSSVGTGAVTGKFVKMPEAMVGADYYVELTFDENCGVLGSGKDADIKTRFSRTNWVEYDQRDDYSFNTNHDNKFMDWTKATVYIGDELVWGQEPSEPLQVSETAKVQMYNKHRNDAWKSINAYYNLYNSGNVQIKLSDVVIRYYYTKDGTQDENFVCDWSSIGSDKITSKFITLPEEFCNDKVTNFIDIGFKEDAGYIIAGDSLEIQSRIQKSDWSYYTQSNDYSFNPADTHYIDWNKVSVYIRGKLVWGDGVIAEIPENIKSTATENTINLSWDKVYSATSYDVEADGVIKSVGASVYYTDTGLQPGSDHKYRVRAVSSVNTGEWSDIVDIWTIPGITQNIAAISTNSSIIVSWEPIEGVTSYEIEVEGMPVDVGLNTSYTHEGLGPNTQRVYRVRGKNSSGTGKWSETIAKSTLPGSSFGISSSATSQSITLAWDKASGASGYDLEIDGAVLNDINDCKYVHDNLLPSTEHTYRVRPKNSDGIGDWTELIKVYTLPETPTGLNAVVDGDSITVSWNEAKGAQTYEIEVDGAVYGNGDKTTYLFNGLKSNSEHIFRVRALFNGTASFWSKTVSTSTLPAVPVNLQTKGIGNNVELAWDMTEGALSYDIEVNGKTLTGIKVNKYTVENITANTKYTFRVRSVGISGESEWSAPVEFKSLIGIPQGLTAIAANDSISLKWQEVEGATGYDVMADGDVLDVSTATYYVHRGLQPNTLHVYRVRAKNGDAAGEWTEPLLKTTVQGVPGNLRAIYVYKSVMVTWDPVSGATGYELKVDGSIINAGNGCSYLHSDLRPNSTHTYSVRSKKNDDVSGWSTEITIKTAPDVPQNLKAESTTNSIRLSWDAVSGALSYDVEVDGNILIDVATTSYYIHDNLESNTKHSYRVRSRNEDSVSEWSVLLQKNTNTELQINAGKDNYFNFVFVIPAKYDATARTITVEYNPDELEVVDLCAVTPTLDTNTGEVKGTDITVEAYTMGRIVYKVKDTTKTQVNSIKFQARVNGYSKVVYEVK